MKNKFHVFKNKREPFLSFFDKNDGIVYAQMKVWDNMNSVPAAAVWLFSLFYSKSSHHGMRE
jgi:hypothetical protein